MEQNGIDCNLYNCRDLNQFLCYKKRIEKNDYFISKNTIGKRMYSCALNHYGDYLKFVHQTSTG